MNKKLLSCILALALIFTLAFSAGAVYARSFAADVIQPFDGEVLGDEDETIAQGEPEIVIYGAEDDASPTLSADPENEPGEVVTEPEKKSSPVKGILICLVIGLVIALIVTLSVKASYKPVQRKRDAAQYLVDGSVRITASEETFLRSERSERKIQNNNNDSSGA